MTVLATSKDPDGLLLQTQITALNTQINNTASTLTKESLRVKLDSLQREAVYHFLDVGRIAASTVLSTLS